MQVKIKRLHPDARMPEYATDGSGCFDLYAADVENHNGGVQYNIGLAFDIPEGHVMLVYSRSGHGFNHNATLINSVGVIDSDYIGSVRVKLNGNIPAGVGDRIAQAMIIPVPKIEFEWSEELTQTERGTNGFGSSGLK